ncbi:hypothetical protein GCM10010954_23860 [Halobacillus andaensis]|uniref:Uncharacterized protein n=1 Tax=Halobacillus andaensis TaxID=1176239 RepID=A0A917B6S6_HALAA|nr:hypothetical protein [Halobacillus andaensis]MBP2006024.1 CHASE3 domain sensor protein [Halobacillus andaensis]GGF24193.1 hypothetical protein GCM10010954_23860 [Halobacillus andaensis]
MTTVQEFYKFKKNGKDRIEELEKKIKDGEKHLPIMREQYKQLVSDGDDNKADNLYPQIKELEESLEANRYKLSTVKEVNSNVIREKAGEVVKQAPAILNKHQLLIDDFVKELQADRQEYAQKVLKLYDLKSDYESEIRKYEGIFNMIDWDKSELNKYGGHQVRAVLDRYFHGGELKLHINDLAITANSFNSIAKGEV